MKTFLLKTLLLLLLPLVVFAEEEVPEDIVTIKENSIELTEIDGAVELTLKLNVKDGFFAYIDKFELDLDNFSAEIITLDPIVTFFDKTFNKNKKGVRIHANLRAKLVSKPDSEINNLSQLTLDLTYQACTEEYCLFPTHTKLKHQLSTEEQKIIQSTQKPSWLKGGWFLGLLFVFMAGFFTSLTPCVYPMLPITIAVLGANKSGSHFKGFIKSSIYVLGMAVTYSLLGVFAATTGFMFGSLLSNSYFLLALGLVLFVGALSMFDVFELKTPSFIENRLSKGSKKSSYVGLFISGAFSGLIVGPCVGPVLVGVLGYVSQTQDMLLGFSLLFSFALGLGALIILMGTFSNLLEKLPRSGTWMIAVKKLMGLTFLVLIIYFIRPLLQIRDLTIITSVIFALFGLILILRQKKNSHTGILESSIYKSIFIFGLLLAISSSFLSHERFERFFGYSGSTFANTHWDIYTDEKLALANTNDQYVVLDFYADWCAACRELKHKTFSKDEVSKYSDKIKWLYFDSTKSGNKLAELKKKYNIVGLPTILFFDQNGVLKKELTLTGFEEPELFVKRLDKLFLKGE